MKAKNVKVSVRKNFAIQCGNSLIFKRLPRFFHLLKSKLRSFKKISIWTLHDPCAFFHVCRFPHFPWESTCPCLFHIHRTCSVSSCDFRNMYHTSWLPRSSFQVQAKAERDDIHSEATTHYSKKVLPQPDFKSSVGMVQASVTLETNSFLLGSCLTSLVSLDPSQKMVGIVNSIMTVQHWCKIWRAPQFVITMSLARWRDLPFFPGYVISDNKWGDEKLF